MTNLINVLNNEGTLVVSSREVAENFDKRHDHTLRNIENIISNDSTQNWGQYFVPSEYKDSSGKINKEYLLTRDGFSLLVMGFTGQKALEWKLKYIEAFNKMEQALKPKSIEDLIIMQAQSVKELKNKMDKVEAITENLNHRVSNLDCVNIDGTPRQRLNAMIKKYSFEKGINFGSAWGDFTKHYNTAFETNIKLGIYHYKAKNHIKNMSVPEFLEVTGQMQDALRIADKMLNEVA